MVPGSLQHNSGKLGLALRFFDALVVVLSLQIAGYIVGVDLAQPYARYDLAVAWAIVFFFFCAEIHNLYGSRRLSSLKEESIEIAVIWAVTSLSLIVVAFLTKTSVHFSRLTIGTWFLTVPTLLIAQRIAIRVVLRHLRKHGRNTRSLAIAGAARVGQRVAESIANAKWTGLTLVGVFDDRSDTRLNIAEHGEFRRQGNFADLVQRARAGSVDYVFIALSTSEQQRTLGLIEALSDTTASVYVVPDLFAFDVTHAKWISFDGIPMISVFETPFYSIDGWLKRVEDIVVSVLVLAVGALPMLALAVASKLSSPGPLLFKQRRYGLNGKTVEVWKLRTMTVCEDGTHVSQAKRDDPRVTRLGAFLRRTSLDEMPQFINVLQGRMSIVGPRPHAIAHNEQYRRLIQGYMLRHKVKPGITGWAQVNGWRGETDTLEKMAKRIEFDLEYVQKWSLGLDLKIIALTVVKGFLNRNAY
jgi:putative colanic acid biosynthesis UDP-glucose lipid carrier transferase